MSQMTSDARGSGVSEALRTGRGHVEKLNRKANTNIHALPLSSLLLFLPIFFHGIAALVQSLEKTTQMGDRKRATCNKDYMAYVPANRTSRYAHSRLLWTAPNPATRG